MYCPQCGSSDVIKYTKPSNNDQKKKGHNQKRKQTSTQMKHAFCQSCGYSWDFDESQLNRTVYNVDGQQNDSKDKNRKPFRDIKGKIDEMAQKGQEIQDEDLIDPEDDDFGCMGVILVILLICLVIIGCISLVRQSLNDEDEAIDTEKEEVQETKFEGSEPEEDIASSDFTKMTVRNAVDSLGESVCSNYSYNLDENSSNIVVFSYSD